MSHSSMPPTLEEIDPQRWETFRPYFEELEQREIVAGDDNITISAVRRWLADWSQLSELVEEARATLYIEKTLDTADQEKQQAYLDLINHVIPPVRMAEQALKERLLGLNMNGKAWDDMALVLRDIGNEVELFRAENVPLLTKLTALENEYDTITGSMKTDWDGEEKNLSQLSPFLYNKDRALRERAWRATMDLWLEKREALNALYTEMLDWRQQVATNAGLPDYRAYAFREMGRFDYTPQDCLAFHEAIEAVVVPAAQRIYKKKQEKLGLARLRPWDTLVDTSDAPPLKPYQDQAELVAGSLQMFQKVDPELDHYFQIMAQEDLLDLETRPGKALGGYCETLPLRKRPFIFMNGVGLHDDVQTLLHEAGHAFHVFATNDLPLTWHKDAPLEFCEVASMAMELLAAPYLTKEQGGFYTQSEAARARIEHLEGIITFFPYMAVVDAFQHWVYTHPETAADPANCDATWNRLWQRFMKGVDWQGYEEERVTGWHRKLHIFSVPFYYIEYGMAQVGALQVWRNSQLDQTGALDSYRRALSYGATKTLPALFAAAGAEFRFDKPMLSELVTLLEETIAELETIL